MGKLTAGGDAACYDAPYDSSGAQIVNGILSSAAVFAGTGGYASHVRNTDTDPSVVPARAGIAAADRVMKGMVSRVVVTMEDGSRCLFDCRTLATKKLVAAVDD